MEQHKGYYAIIPANVRYDTSLTANAKLLYGEITALCNEKGFCWAGNEYFAGLYGVSKTSISKWVSSLVNNRYLICNFSYREGTKEILNRCLTIVNDPYNINYIPSITKVNDPIEEKLIDNNTVNITMNNTINKGDKSPRSTFQIPTVEEINDYCKGRNTIDGQNFFDFYESKGWLIGKNKMKDWKAAVRTWERRDSEKAQGGQPQKKSFKDLIK